MKHLRLRSSSTCQCSPHAIISTRSSPSTLSDADAALGCYRRNDVRQMRLPRKRQRPFIYTANLPIHPIGDANARPAADDLFGEHGDDRLYGSNPDRLFGGSGSDDHLEGPGDDQVFMGDDVEGNDFGMAAMASTLGSPTLEIRPSTPKHGGWNRRDAYSGDSTGIRVDRFGRVGS